MRRRQEAVTTRGALGAAIATHFSGVSGISLQWILFGSAGHATPPAAGQQASYTRCNPERPRQLKCLAHAAELHPRGAFREAEVHQCTFETGAVVALGDGSLPAMRKVEIEGIAGSSHKAHLYGDALNGHTAITDELQVVLFHYVTRSRSEFVSRKVRQGTGGVYQQAYMATAAELLGEEKKRKALRDEDAEAEVFAALEARFGLDGDAAICHQGAAAAAAVAAARAAGWSEFAPSWPLL